MSQNPKHENRDEKSSDNQNPVNSLENRQNPENKNSLEKHLNQKNSESNGILNRNSLATSARTISYPGTLVSIWLTARKEEWKNQSSQLIISNTSQSKQQDKFNQSIMIEQPLTLAITHFLSIKN